MCEVWLCTCWCTAAEGGGRGDGWGDRRGEVSTGVARRSGNTAAAQIACQRQRQLGLHLLLHGLVLSPCSICHKPAIMGCMTGKLLSSYPMYYCGTSPMLLLLNLCNNTCLENIVGSFPIKKTLGFMVGS